MTTPDYRPVAVPPPPPLAPQPPSIPVLPSAGSRAARKVGRDLMGMIYGTVICAVVGVAFYFLVQYLGGGRF